MTAIYLIRHGQTEWNREEIFRGRADVPLDDLGRRQAEALGRAFVKQGIEKPLFISSPLKRARETADTAAGFLGVTELKTDKAFIDLSFGEWEGRSVTDVQKEYPVLYRSWLEHPENVIFPGGEQLDEAADRAEEGLYRVANANRGKDVVIVTHRVISKVLLCRILSAGIKAFWKLRQDTACLNELNYNGTGFVLVKMNDTCHLQSLGRDPGDF